MQSQTRQKTITEQITIFQGKYTSTIKHFRWYHGKSRTEPFVSQFSKNNLKPANSFTILWLSFIISLMLKFVVVEFFC